MMIAFLSQHLLIPSAVNLQIQEPVNLVLSTVAAIFALILTILSVYGWTRYRNNSLLLFSLAFFFFFLKIVIDELVPITPFYSEFLASLLDFVTLSLFFLALIVGSRRKKTPKAINGTA
jgi:hypothetical protein